MGLSFTLWWTFSRLYDERNDDPKPEPNNEFYRSLEYDLANFDGNNIIYHTLPFLANETWIWLSCNLAVFVFSQSMIQLTMVSISKIKDLI